MSEINLTQEEYTRIHVLVSKQREFMRQLELKEISTDEYFKLLDEVKKYYKITIKD